MAEEVVLLAMEQDLVMTQIPIPKETPILIIFSQKLETKSTISRIKPKTPMIT